jgi:hypothetical protein
LDSALLLTSDGSGFLQVIGQCAPAWHHVRGTTVVALRWNRDGEAELLPLLSTEQIGSA